MTESLSTIEVAEIAESLGIDWDEVPFRLEQFRAGLIVELGVADVPDLLEAGRIVLARLEEEPDHYRGDAPWGPDGELGPPP
jgi:hypothetical protein